MTTDKKIYECIGKGGRYMVVYSALPAGTLKSIVGLDSLVVYQNDKGLTFVRTREDFEARMRELTE